LLYAERSVFFVFFFEKLISPFSLSTVFTYQIRQAMADKLAEAREQWKKDRAKGHTSTGSAPTMVCRDLDVDVKVNDSQNKNEKGKCET